MNLPPLPDTFIPSQEFPSLNHWAFFNHSGVSPVSRRAADAIRRYLDQSQHDAYMTGKWYKQAETTRAAAAKLLNADVTEIAFVKNTSEGLSFIANGLSWKPGDEIVSARVEYPANVYPWMDAAERHGVKHIMVSERVRNGAGRIEIEDLFAAVTPRTRLIAISHVEYASGYRNDLAAIGRFCRERGILFCVDAIQSVGVLPVDVKAMQIDFLSAGGHKWMLGPEGIGIFFCRRELFSEVRPEVGWMNVVHYQDFTHHDFRFREDARRFECGGYNLAGVLGLGGSLEMLHDLGPDLIWRRAYGLTSMLTDGLRAKGYHVYSPRETEEESSGIVSFTSPLHAPDPIVKSLEEQKIIITKREERLRAAPHFYQGPEQIQRLLDALPAH